METTSKPARLSVEHSVVLSKTDTMWMLPTASGNRRACVLFFCQSTPVLQAIPPIMAIPCSDDIFAHRVSDPFRNCSLVKTQKVKTSNEVVEEHFLVAAFINRLPCSTFIYLLVYKAAITVKSWKASMSSPAGVHDWPMPRAILFCRSWSGVHDAVTIVRFGEQMIVKADEHFLVRPRFVGVYCGCCCPKSDPLQWKRRARLKRCLRTLHRQTGNGSDLWLKYPSGIAKRSTTSLRSFLLFAVAWRKSTGDMAEQKM